LGFDPIWFGVIVVLSTSIGKLTPPFGLGVFTVKAVVGSEVTAEDIFKGCTYYYVSVLLSLAILLIFPQISLFLPNTMIGD
jgi:TRAP-type C4-dicarboxylate transport system permease large subunit